MNIFEGQIEIGITYAVVFKIIFAFDKYLPGLVMCISIHLAFERKCALLVSFELENLLIFKEDQVQSVPLTPLPFLL